MNKCNSNYNACKTTCGTDAGTWLCSGCDPYLAWCKKNAQGQLSLCNNHCNYKSLTCQKACACPCP